MAAGVYGVVLLAGAALGSTNPLAPIPQLAAKQTHLEFKRIKTVADLEREVAAASAAGKSVMVDFYADWCVSCKEMEHKTFTRAGSAGRARRDVVLLQADVTANDDEDRALLMHFGIVGPPTIAFYGADGTERRNFRVVGFMKAAEFAAVVRQAVAPATPTTHSEFIRILDAAPAGRGAGRYCGAAAARLLRVSRDAMPDSGQLTAVPVATAGPGGSGRAGSAAAPKKVRPRHAARHHARGSWTASPPSSRASAAGR